VVKGGLLEQRVLQIGEPQADMLPVLQGLAAGEQLAAVYRPELKNGLGVE
jgi:hypothetical protein